MNAFIPAISRVVNPCVAVLLCAGLAACGGGSGGSSTPTTTTTNTVPGAPAISATVVATNSVAISFNAPASNGGAAITAYTASCTAGTATQTVNGAASPLTVSGLTANTMYSCSVLATNSVGNSAASASVSITTLAAAAGGVTTLGVLCTYSTNAFNSSAAVNATSTSSWSCGTTNRMLTGNGIPDHPVTGGNFATAMSAQTINVSMTLTPAAAASATNIARGTTGYVLNSVKLDPGTDGTCASTATSTANGAGCVAAGGRDPWNLEAIGGAFVFGTDTNNAHTQPNGLYHYHGMPEGFVTKLNKGVALTLVGFALDGFPVYARYGYTTASSATSAVKIITASYQKKTTPDAGRPSVTVFPLGTFTQDYQYVAGSGDLDECNGRTGVTPEFPNGIYHYYITETYPYIQRCVKGTPSAG